MSQPLPLPGFGEKCALINCKEIATEEAVVIGPKTIRLCAKHYRSWQAQG